MDPARFALFWTTLEPRLRAYLAACMRDRGAIDDLVQEVAVAAWRKRRVYDPDRDALAWVLGFARLAVLRHCRDRARDRHVLDEDLIATLAQEIPAAAPEIDRRLQALEACRQGLEDRARELLALAYGRDLPLATVAEQMNASPGAIRTALCRLRERLRRCVERRLAGGEP